MCILLKSLCTTERPVQDNLLVYIVATVLWVFICVWCSGGASCLSSCSSPSACSTDSSGSSGSSTSSKRSSRSPEYSPDSHSYDDPWDYKCRPDSFFARWWDIASELFGLFWFFCHDTARKRLKDLYTWYHTVVVLEINFTYWGMSCHMKTKIAHGRRWEIWREEVDGRFVATKQALDESKRWAIRRETEILRYMNLREIDFVPVVLDAGEGRFSYEWIEGEHFWSEFRKNVMNGKQRRQLALALFECASKLDQVGVVHGELARPTKNVLVGRMLPHEPSPLTPPTPLSPLPEGKAIRGELDPHFKVFIIDFERGKRGDFSGKNMKHVAQWMARQWLLDLEVVKSLGQMTREEIYERVTSKIAFMWTPHAASPVRTSVHLEGRGVCWWVCLGICSTICAAGVLFCIDLLTKYIYVDLEKYIESDWITPSINTGVAWSIPIPMWVTIGVSVLFLCGFVWYMREEMRRKLSYILYIWASLLLWWALWNLYDRIRLWWVRDFLDVNVLTWLIDIHRPIFNLADVWIMVWVVVLCVYEMRKSE